MKNTELVIVQAHFYKKKLSYKFSLCLFILPLIFYNSNNNFYCVKVFRNKRLINLGVDHYSSCQLLSQTAVVDMQGHCK